MKNNTSCEVIRDLLPLYIDALTSEETNGIIKEHIDECEDCRAVLDRMIADSTAPVKTDDKKTIDFLKTTRKKNRKSVLIAALISIAAAVVLVLTAVVLAVNFIPRDIDADDASLIITVREEIVYLEGSADDKKLQLSGADVTAEDGIVKISLKAVRKNVFNNKYFCAEWNTAQEVKQVYIDDRIVWEGGERISDFVSQVYAERHLYMGEMTANTDTATALGMYKVLGNCTNQLFSSQEPYGWTLFVEEEILPEELAKKEEYMQSCAYVLLGLIDNLGVINYEYTVGGEVKVLTVTTAQADAFAGESIKNCYDSVLSLQNVIKKAPAVLMSLIEVEKHEYY